MCARRSQRERPRYAHSGRRFLNIFPIILGSLRRVTECLGNQIGLNLFGNASCSNIHYILKIKMPLDSSSKTSKKISICRNCETYFSNSNLQWYSCSWGGSPHRKHAHMSREAVSKGAFVPCTRARPVHPHRPCRNSSRDCRTGPEKWFQNTHHL